MGKFTTFVMVMSGLTLLFYITGLIPSNPLITLLFNPQNMSTSSFYITILATIATSVSAIIIGFVTKNLELAAMTAFVPIIAALLWGFIDVYNSMAAVNRIISILIIGPTLFMFTITLLDYWRGRD